MQLQTAGILFHPKVEATRTLAESMAAELRQQGLTLWVDSGWESQLLIEEISRCDLLFTLGGDGTILRAARAATEAMLHFEKAPLLLSVDFGRLGFLAELQPDEVLPALPRVLAGDFWVEHRRLLRAEHLRDGEVVATAYALNEIVLTRSEGPAVLRLGLRIDGAEVTRYVADGIIVATPTGSTAYAYAAGGPILAPSLDGLLVIPIAPHLTWTRSIVAPADTLIEVSAESHLGAIIAADGQQTSPWATGDTLRVTTGAQRVGFVRLGSPNYFYATVNTRLGKPRPV